SATALELPRLTNPALEGELPPEWEDLLADEFASQRAASERRRNGPHMPDYGIGDVLAHRYPGANYGSRSSYNGWPSETGQDAWPGEMSHGQWPSQTADAGLSQPPQYREPSMAQGGAPLPPWERPQSRGASAYAEDYSYDQPAWTARNGAEHRPSHWVR